ncbi:MAG: sugar ABC transporter permease [Eubacteriales bacterium]|nr:sugar ABC transporter permease [Eubacteriales bacterium]
MKKNNTLYAYLMSSPAMLVLTVLSVFPLLFILWYSLTDYYYLSTRPPQFVLFDNYIKLFKDRYFMQALGNTLRFTALAVLFEVTLGLMVAVLVKSFKRGQEVLRTVTLLPTLLPPVTVALIWQIMLSNNYGLINSLLGLFGLGPVSWLTDVNTAFYAILVIDIWQYTPFAFLLLYAAMQGIPQGQYEAASIDGAGKWAQFHYVTMPNIFHNVVMVTLLRVIDTFRLFDKVNILTKGGPANTTATITQYIYHNGVNMFKVGYASAASVVMTLIILFLAAGYIRQNFKARERAQKR